jgi:hypothetical protein
VLFLDDAFCSDRVAQPLIDAGFRVETFAKHFPDPERVRQQDVKDKPVIKLCHRWKWLIVTRDLNMRITHVEAIKAHPDTMILATASNSEGDLASWVNALIVAKKDVEKKFRRQGRPWFAQFDRQGNVTVCRTIDCNSTTRRTRPKEH